MHRRFPSFAGGEGLEPTAIFLPADGIVRAARANEGAALRGLSPSAMEKALVARMLHDLETPTPRRMLAPPPNPFLVPPGPGDPPPPWARPPRRYAESRTTLIAPEAPKKKSRARLVPLLLFLAFGAAAFAHTAPAELLARIIPRP